LTDVEPTESHTDDLAEAHCAKIREIDELAHRLEVALRELKLEVALLSKVYKKKGDTDVSR